MDFTEHRNGSLLYTTADSFTAAGGVRHAFLTRHGGVSRGYLSSLNLGFNRGDEPENVRENYRIVCDTFSFSPDRCVLSLQVHEDGIRRVTEADAGKGLVRERDYEADGLMTDVPDLPLFIFTADCVPLLFYDPVHRAVAAVHAGWRGTALDIAGKAVAAMAEAYGTRPGDLLAAVGYCIRKCCFETDRDVPEAMEPLLDAQAGPFLGQTGEKFHVDLQGINRALLLRRGVPAGNISVLPHCTVCMHDTYWSHRYTAGRRGSQASVICLE